MHLIDKQLRVKYRFFFFSDRFALLGIAIGGGFGIFAVFFIFAFLYETHLKRRTLLNDPEAQAALKKEKDKKKRKAAIKKAMKEKKGAWTRL